MAQPSHQVSFLDIDEQLKDVAESLTRLQQEMLPRRLASMRPDEPAPMSTCNLVSKILAGLPNPLDQLWNRLPNKQTRNFPFCNSVNDFAARMRGEPELDSRIVDAVRDFQTYGENSWSRHFTALSNVHKHIGLVPERK